MGLWITQCSFAAVSWFYQPFPIISLSSLATRLMLSSLSFIFFLGYETCRMLPGGCPCQEDGRVALYPCRYFELSHVTLHAPGHRSCAQQLIYFSALHSCCSSGLREMQITPLRKLGSGTACFFFYMYFIESWDCFFGKRPLRSSSPTLL